jgi:chromosome segregation ATPase
MKETKQQIIDKLNVEVATLQIDLEGAKLKIRELKESINNKNGDIIRHNDRLNAALEDFRIQIAGVTRLLKTIESWNTNHTKRKHLEEYCAYSLNKIFKEFKWQYPGALYLSKIEIEEATKDMPF